MRALIDSTLQVSLPALRACRGALAGLLCAAVVALAGCAGFGGDPPIPVEPSIDQRPPELIAKEKVIAQCELYREVALIIESLELQGQLSSGQSLAFAAADAAGAAICLQDPLPEGWAAVREVTASIQKLSRLKVEVEGD